MHSCQAIRTNRTLATLQFAECLGTSISLDSPSSYPGTRCHLVLKPLALLPPLVSARVFGR